ncbi:MAG TPA: efflux RND transporter periplasmic adaptor subunit [Candidatus Sulfotelmatobacter sp.]|nr:efflux RND transporter periplasmic adaptor subunit [Candidatus Sulfotelmatobacter sp.]
MKAARIPIYVTTKAVVLLALIAAAAIAAGLLISRTSRGQEGNSNKQQASSPNSQASKSETTLDLSASQISSIQIEPVGTYKFPVEKEAVGDIDFDGDLSVPVFPAYQGTIIKTFVELGAEVQKDQPLYTIKSPDLIQAESTLIGAAAVYEMTTKELARAKELYTANVGVPQKELEQAISDQQTAEGALKAARDAVLVFGKTDAEIDQMIASRKIDPALVVRSPITGKVTYKNAQPGFFVQPGNPPAPYSVADVKLKWMLATVPESESEFFHLHQPVEAKVLAYPGRAFKGQVSKIYETVDSNTHRLTIRSEITDPQNLLLPGMLANFTIRVEGPVEATAIPANGVVREPDGTMTAWVTTDRHRFSQRVLKIGLRQDDRVQVLAGLQQGELVVSDGAVFLSNMLEAPPSD